MSMYECENCREDHCTFPNVFLAINKSDPIYPYHNSLWENFFAKINQSVRDLDLRWRNFYAWLGETGHKNNSNIKNYPADNGLKWFCSKECAIKYLENKQ